MNNNYLTNQKVEIIKDDLNRISRSIKNKIVPNLKNAWVSNEADEYIEKVEALTIDIKKIIDKFDELSYQLNKYTVNKDK